MDKKLAWVLGGCVLVLVLVACAALGVGGYLLWQRTGSLLTSLPEAPSLARPTPTAVGPAASGATLPPSLTPEEQEVMQDTLAALQRREAPENDPVALAHRLKHVTDTWATPGAPPPHKVGDTAAFWVGNQDTTENFQVTATLAYMQPHVYFWVQQGVSYNQRALQRLVDTFENKIYPTDRAFFGSEWTPGIDGDPHLYILYTRGIGSWVAGYFSAADEIPPFAHKYSNAHEMFVLNADNIDLSSDFTYGVLAHEFQHMIHWYRDRNETTWLNEGASELASLLNDYDPGGSDRAYARQSDTQLNAWVDPQSADPSANYGASFLFMTYFLGRFGEQATRTLIGRPENGLESVDLTLQEIGTGLMADDLFADWAAANWVQDTGVGDGRYGYTNYAPPSFKPAEKVTSCPAGGEATVHQYGVDYIQLACKGDYVLHFQGATTVPLFPARPHSGQFAFWTGYGDESDITLTRKFDLRDVSSARLSYWLWYDIEKDYDYLYVEVSTDGRWWDVLQTPSGTDANPSGNNYGWGYTGTSGGATPRWIHEEVDLSPYAGKQVWVRFEYITDAAVNHTGALLDDIQLSAVGYRTDFEQDDGGWRGEGFVRVGQWLPQTFRVTLVTRKNGTIEVQPLALNAAQTASVPVDLGGDAVLIVSGTTRGTREAAHYRWSLQVP